MKILRQLHHNELKVKSIFSAPFKNLTKMIEPYEQARFQGLSKQGLSLIHNLIKTSSKT